jgi:hypothetical protein
MPRYRRRRSDAETQETSAPDASDQWVVCPALCSQSVTKSLIRYFVYSNTERSYKPIADHGSPLSPARSAGAGGGARD